MSTPGTAALRLCSKCPDLINYALCKQGFVKFSNQNKNDCRQSQKPVKITSESHGRMEVEWFELLRSWFAPARCPANAASVHHEELHQAAASVTAECPGDTAFSGRKPVWNSVTLPTRLDPIKHLTDSNLHVCPKHLGTSSHLMMCYVKQDLSLGLFRFI